MYLAQSQTNPAHAYTNTHHNNNCSQPRNPKTGIRFDDRPERQRQVEGIGLGRLREEMAWLRGKLDGEDYGTTRAKEVRAL